MSIEYRPCSFLALPFLLGRGLLLLAGLRRGLGVLSLALILLLGLSLIRLFFVGCGLVILSLWDDTFMTSTLEVGKRATHR